MIMFYWGLGPSFSFWIWFNCAVSILSIYFKCFVLLNPLCVNDRWILFFTLIRKLVAHDNYFLSFHSLFRFNSKFELFQSIIINIIDIALNCNELQTIQFWSFNCLLECICIVAIILSSLVWIFIFACNKLLYNIIYMGP